MIKNGDWVDDPKKTRTGKSKWQKKKDKDKKYNAFGGIIHNKDTEEDAGTMEYVLANVNSNSNAVKCHNYFDPN